MKPFCPPHASSTRRAAHVAIVFLSLSAALAPGLASAADEALPGDNSDAVVKAVGESLDRLKLRDQANGLASATEDQRLKQIADREVANAQYLLADRSAALNLKGLLRLNGTLDEHITVVEWNKQVEAMFPDKVVAALFQKLTPEMRDQFLLDRLHSLEALDRDLAQLHDALQQAITIGDQSAMDAANILHRRMRNGEVELVQVEGDLRSFPGEDKTVQSLMKHVASTRQSIASMQPEVDKYGAQEQLIILNKAEGQFAKIQDAPKDSSALESDLIRLSWIRQLPRRYDVERVKALQERYEQLFDENRAALAAKKMTLEQERTTPVTALGRPSQVVRAVFACILGRNLREAADKMMIARPDQSAAHPSTTPGLLNLALYRPLPVLEHVIDDCAVVRVFSKNTGSNRQHDVILLKKEGRWLMYVGLDDFDGARGVADGPQKERLAQLRQWVQRLKDDPNVVKSAQSDTSSAPADEIPSDAKAQGSALTAPNSSVAAAPDASASAPNRDPGDPAAIVKALIAAVEAHQNDAAIEALLVPGYSRGRWCNYCRVRIAYKTGHDVGPKGKYVGHEAAIGNEIATKTIGDHAVVAYDKGNPSLKDRYTVFNLVRIDGNWKLYADGLDQVFVVDKNPSKTVSGPHDPKDHEATAALAKWFDEYRTQTQPAPSVVSGPVGNTALNARESAFEAFLQQANKDSLAELQKQLKDRPQDLQKIGMKLGADAADQYQMDCLFDPGQYALAIIEHYEKLKDDARLRSDNPEEQLKGKIAVRELEQKSRDMDFHYFWTLADKAERVASVSPERIRRSENLHAWKTLAPKVNEGRYTEAQADAIAASVGDKMAKQFDRDNPPGDLQSFDDAFTKYLQEGEQSVTNPAVATHAQAPANDQIQDQPAQADSKSKKQEDRTEDDSNRITKQVKKNVNKAKSAANKLRGLFGHH